MRHRLLISLVAASVAALLSACGSDSGDESPASGQGGAAGSSGQGGAGGTSAGASGQGGSPGEGGSSAAGGASGQAGSGEGGAGGSGEAGAGQGGSGEAGMGGVVTPGPLPQPVPVQALRRIWVGETDMAGNPDSEAWRKLGFDLDGVTSTPASTGHCKPYKGGSKAEIQDDGDEGIDNSFGRNVIPLLTMIPGSSTTPSKDISAYVEHGVFSMLLHIDGLPESGDATGLATSIYAARGKAGDMPGKYVSPTTQQWQDGSYAWRAISTSVDSSDPLKAKAFFPNSGIASYTWTSGTTDHSLELIIPVNDVEMHLRIHNVRLRATFSSDLKGSTGGILGGIIVTDEFVAELSNVAGQINPVYCGPIVGAIAENIRKASDIMVSGQQDPEQTCDGISVGLGFETAAAQVDDIVVPAPVANPCGGM